jgi:HD-like signal output (HDOD) protein
LENLATTAFKIREIPEIPAMPVAAQQILGLLSDDDIVMSKLVKIIDTDPALTARIIGIANSAFFGCREGIYSIQDAITRVLGINTVTSIALSIFLSGPFKSIKCPEFDQKGFWVTSLLTATLARRILPHSKLLSKYNQEQIYLSGLLHNFGLLVLVYAFPAKVAQILSLTNFEKASTTAELECRTIGINRFQAGAILTHKWHLPKEVVAMIEHHNNPQYKGEHSGVALLIGACSELAQQIYRNLDADESNISVLEKLDVIPEKTAVAIDAVKNSLEEITSLADRFTAD